MESGPLQFLSYGWWILGVQCCPLVHFCVSRSLNPCRRTGYSTLYLMVVLMTWIVAIILAELLQLPWQVPVVLLLLPLFLWAYPFSRGRENEMEFNDACPRCETRPGKPQSR